MGLLDLFRGARSWGSADEIVAALDQGGSRTSAGIRAFRPADVNKGWGFGANRQIAARGSTVECILERHQMDGLRVDVRRIFQHPVLDLLRDPNADQSGMEFHWSQILRLQTYGAAIVVVIPGVIEGEIGSEAEGRWTRMKMTTIHSLRSLNPEKVTIEAVGGRALGRFIYRGSGKPLELPAGPRTHAEMASWRDNPYTFAYRVALPDADGGHADPSAAMSAPGKINRDLRTLWGNQLTNGVHSGDRFYISGNMEDITRYQRAIQMIKQGINAAGEPMFLPKGLVEVESTNASAEKMQFSEMNQEARRESLSVLGGSDALVGLVDNVSRSNLWAYEWMLARGTVDPLNQLIADAMNRSLVPCFTGQSYTSQLRVRFGSSAMVDEKDRTDIILAKVGGPVMTPNEGRRELGLPEVEGGDELYPKQGAASAEEGSSAVPSGGEAVDDVAEQEDEGRVRYWQDIPLHTHDGRSQAWYRMEARSAPFYDDFEEKTRRLYERQEADVLKKIEEQGEGLLAANAPGRLVRTWFDADADDEVGENISAIRLEDPGDIFDKELWEREFQEMYQATVPAAMLDAYVSTARDIGFDEDFFSLVDPRAVQFSSARGFEYSKAVNETTRKQLARVLTEAVEEGWSVDRFRVAIEDTYGAIKGSRPLAAARTEIASAQEWAADQATKDATGFGMRIVTMWISSRDPRVRETHARADSQTIRQGERFRVGACMMEYPLDSASCGLAGEIINCRCRTVRIVE